MLQSLFEVWSVECCITREICDVQNLMDESFMVVFHWKKTAIIHRERKRHRQRDIERQRDRDKRDRHRQRQTDSRFRVKICMPRP